MNKLIVKGVKMSGKIPHTINWFEIPVKDINRAVRFYETVLEVKLELEEREAFKLAVFPGHSDDPSTQNLDVHGALIQGQGYEPSDQGTLVYFNGQENLNPYLKRVIEAGGTVLREKTSIGEHGYIAWFKDTEGNRVAFHSQG